MAEDPHDDGRRADDPKDAAADADGETAAPLSDLAERVRRRREGAGSRRRAAGDADDPFEALFREEPFEAVERRALWQSIEAQSAEGPVATEDAPDEYVVPKRSYCETCEHLSEPPEMRCTHPGTTIVEFADNDHLRVRNCPVVAERQLLGEFREPGTTPDSFGRR